MPNNRKARLVPPELILVAFLVGFVAYQIGIRRCVAFENASRYPDDPTLEQTLRAKYGPGHHSAQLEEWIVRDFFQDQRGGMFADIGAWHWQEHNNTVALEQVLGWSGLAVDAVDSYTEGWRKHRPRPQFVVAFVDDVDGQPRTLDVPVNASHLASERGNSTMHATTADHGPTVQKQTVSATLDTLLQRGGSRG